MSSTHHFEPNDIFVLNDDDTKPSSIRINDMYDFPKYLLEKYSRMFQDAIEHSGDSESITILNLPNVLKNFESETFHNLHKICIAYKKYHKEIIYRPLTEHQPELDLAIALDMPEIISMLVLSYIELFPKYITKLKFLKHV